MFYVLKGMAFLSIVLGMYFRYLQMYSGDSRCIRYQDSRWVVEQALHANEVTGSEVSHWFSLCTICDLNLLSQSSARMGKVQDCRILQDSYWILWNTILVTWIWPHLWSVETLNQATKQLSFWGPGWKPLGFLIKAVVKPALWPLQREPKEESCLIMSHLIHILYLFNLFALQASVTPKKIFPDWTPACSSLQSDFALATNANPHIAHKDHTLKIRWRVLECYCFLPTSGHVHCLDSLSVLLSQERSISPKRQCQVLTPLESPTAPAVSAVLSADSLPHHDVRIPENFVQIQPHFAGTAGREPEVKAAP